MLGGGSGLAYISALAAHVSHFSCTCNTPSTSFLLSTFGTTSENMTAPVSFQYVASDNQEDAGMFEDDSDNPAFDGLLRFAKFRLRKPCADLELFLEGFRNLLKAQVRKELEQKRCVKVAVCVHAYYEKTTNPDSPLVDGFLRTRLAVILGTYAIDQFVERILTQIRMRHVNFQRDASGLRLKKISVSTCIFANTIPSNEQVVVFKSYPSSC